MNLAKKTDENFLKIVFKMFNEIFDENLFGYGNHEYIKLPENQFGHMKL